MKKTVLLVDDDKNILNLLKEGLEDFSLTVEVAENVESALKIFETKKIDCVVTDIMMPGVTGAELAKKLRLKSDSLPLFFITAYMDYSREELNQFRPKAVIFKPFDIEEAAMLVNNQLMKMS